MFRLQRASHGHRPLPVGSQICKICRSVVLIHPQHAKSPFGTLLVGNKRREILRDGGLSSATASSPMTKHMSRLLLPLPGSSPPRRVNLSGSAARLPGERSHAKSQNLGLRSGSQAAAGASSTAATNYVRPFPPLEKIVAPVQHVKKAFLAHKGIPSEESTLAALRACDVAAGLLRDVLAAAQPHLSSPRTEETRSASASKLLSLDGGRGSADAGVGSGVSPNSDATASGPRFPSPQPKPSVPSDPHPRPDFFSAATGTESAAGSRTSLTLKIKKMIDTVSETAYAIVSLPAVVITPQVLKQYVGIQHRLGRPETLPQVLSMYATKPLPQAAREGSIRYIKQNPNSASKSVEPTVAETALDSAIEAKNLDAAVGIVEGTYATKAFIRSKLIKKTLLPVSCLAVVPVSAYALASNLSHFQNTMDDSTATTIAFAGIVTYLGFTAAIGVMATTTGNDQMKRVTWTPGTSLSQRFTREEERAALDKIACSFGFSELHRFGEEEGAEFEALREYILRKGMILDRVELMEGMGG